MMSSSCPFLAMQFPVAIEFELKHWLLDRRKAIVTDAAGATLMFVDQKTWTLSEEVEIFSDGARSKLLFRLGPSWDQFGNRNFTFFREDSGSGCAVLRIPNTEATRWAMHFKLGTGTAYLLVIVEVEKVGLSTFRFGFTFRFALFAVRPLFALRTQ